MTAIYKYAFICTDEGITKEVWRDNTQPAPTKCPDDTTHIIDVNTRRIIEIVDKNRVQIQEESTPTGGHFKAISRQIDLTGNDTKITDIVFKYNISALAIEYISDVENQGDDLELIIGPDTPIGVITSDVNINDTVINVNDTVLENIDVGFKIKLADQTGTIVEDLGYVLAVDLDNKTITVENPVTQVFLATGPTYIWLNVYTIEDYRIGKPGRWTVGESKIGGSFVPANTIIRIIYHNRTSDPKTFIAQLEYLY